MPLSSESMQPFLLGDTEGIDGLYTCGGRIMLELQRSAVIQLMVQLCLQSARQNTGDGTDAGWE